MRKLDEAEYIDWLEQQLVWHKIREEYELYPKSVAVLALLSKRTEGLTLEQCAQILNSSEEGIATFLSFLKRRLGFKTTKLEHGRYKLTAEFEQFFQRELELLWQEAKSTS